MANVTELSNWETGIYQIETADAVLGGVNGIANKQALQLANRTLWLKNQVADLGTGKQPIDQTLTALAALATAADKLIYATGVDTFATTPLTAFARTLLDDTTAAAALLTLGAAALASPTFTGTPAAPTATDGTNTTQLATTAFVQSAIGGNLQKAVTGGTVTLTEAEASNTSLTFTGVLTSALTIVVPTAVRRNWIVYNNTTGAFDFTIKTGTTAGVGVAQGKRNQVYSDGAKVFDGFNDFDSVALTGVPTAPTAALGTNTTQIATMAALQAAIANLINSSPGALDTLNELATAMGNDPNFAATMTNALSGKQPIDPTLTALAALATAADKLIYATGVDTFATTPLTAFARTLLDDTTAAAALLTLGAAALASPTFTGIPAAPTATDGTNTTQLATTAFVQSAVGGYLIKGGQTGGTITLTDAEASNPVLGISGALTSNLIVIVPVVVKRLWAVYNATSGAFSVTIKTASGTGVTIAQSKRNLVYTDGTNVYDAMTDFDSIALSGTPTSTTAPTGNRSTQIATTNFVGAECSIAAPIGSVYAFAGANSPAGWLTCNGALLSRTTYAALFAVIGTTYGAGDGSTTFALPDFRNMFLRGHDTSTGRGLGSFQDDAIRNIQGEARFSAVSGADTMIFWTSGSFSMGGEVAVGSHKQIQGGATDSYEQQLFFNAANVVPTDVENRPKNKTVNYIIKY